MDIWKCWEGFRLDVFSCCPQRTQKALRDYIEQWIEKRTTMYSDCWKAYDSLREVGYNLLQVNHCLHFDDPSTGCHTNTIESKWRHIKISLFILKSPTKKLGQKNIYICIIFKSKLWDNKTTYIPIYFIFQYFSLVIKNKLPHPCTTSFLMLLHKCVQGIL